MEIEKEINLITPFKSEYQKATINLLFTYNWLSVQLKNYLKPHGCTLQQYNVLRILKGATKPLSTSDIRERMIEKMADTSRLVERLSAKGWVDRQACCGDRRLVDVTISKAGLGFTENLKDIESYINSIYENLTVEEAKQLNLILNKLRAA